MESGADSKDVAENSKTKGGNNFFIVGEHNTMKI